MLKPRLSIIIPTYNERENINPLIQRLVAKQNNIEIIVVDSALTSDKTLDSITYDEVIKINSDKSSRSEQMHLATQKASADLFYFVHADTRPPDNYLDLIEASIAEGNEFGLFSYRFDSSSRLLAINSRFTKKEGPFTGGGDQSFFIDRETYFSANGFDTSLPIMEDFDLYWRLKKRGVSGMIIPHDVIVSARKYERNSYLKVQLVNLATLIGFKWGRDPSKLKAFYTRMLD